MEFGGWVDGWIWEEMKEVIWGFGGGRCLFLFKIDVTSLLMGSWRPCHSLCELIPYAASAQMNDIYKGQRMTVGTAHKEQAAYQVYTYNA